MTPVGWELRTKSLRSKIKFGMAIYLRYLSILSMLIEALLETWSEYSWNNLILYLIVEFSYNRSPWCETSVILRSLFSQNLLILGTSLKVSTLSSHVYWQLTLRLNCFTFIAISYFHLSLYLNASPAHILTELRTVHLSLYLTSLSTLVVEPERFTLKLGRWEIHK